MKMKAIKYVFLFGLCQLFLACPDGGEFITREGDDDDGLCRSDDDCPRDFVCRAGFCVENECLTDDDCPAGQVCVQDQCLEAADYDCGVGETPITSLSVSRLDFGNLAKEVESRQTLTIENLGGCNLVITDMGLSQESAPIFSCPSCDPSRFPIRVPPRRTLDIEVVALTDRVDQYSGELILRTNDFTDHEDGLKSIDLVAKHLGVPELFVTPFDMRFGYVPQGSSEPIPLYLSNVGTGSQEIYINLVALIDEIELDFSDIEFVEEGYFRLDPGDDEVVVPVTFRAPSTGATRDYNTHIVAYIHEGDLSEVRTLDLPVTATTNAPPEMRYSTDALEFCGDTPCTAGDSTGEVRTIQLHNDGNLRFNFDDIQILSNVADGHHFEIVSLFVTGAAEQNPSYIPGGGSLTLAIRYAPTEPSDPNDPNLSAWNQGDRGTPHDAFLRITSYGLGENYDVPIRGYSRLSQIDTGFSVTMRMEIDMGDRDLRDANLQLSTEVFEASIDGGLRGLHHCQKPELITEQIGAEEYRVIDSIDVCERDWALGSARWNSPSTAHNPEKISVYDMPDDDALNTEFVVSAEYATSCVRPNSFWGNLVGVLFAIGNVALAVTTGVVIPVNPADVARTINESCGRGRDLNVEIEIHENGVLQKSLSTILYKEETGQSVEVYRFRRVDGELVFD